MQQSTSVSGHKKQTSWIGGVQPCQNTGHQHSGVERPGNKWNNCKHVNPPRHFALPWALAKVQPKLPAEVGKTFLSCPMQQCKSFNPIYCMPACPPNAVISVQSRKHAGLINQATQITRSMHRKTIEHKSASLLNYLDDILGAHDMPHFLFYSIIFFCLCQLYSVIAPLQLTSL